MSDADVFIQTRDSLQEQRSDYDGATTGFDWPTLTDFNWATDYFDRIAEGNDNPALHIIDEGPDGGPGPEAKLSYAELSVRSNQVANFLVGNGAKRGDRILLMLGNEVPLWETMLAAIKIGSVVIPATTCLLYTSPSPRDA